MTSILVHFGLFPGHWIIFWPEKILTFPPQIWRFWTNFLITGPQLGLLFDTYFLYNYTSALEIGHPRFSKREDVVWYFLFVSSVITVSYASSHVPPAELPDAPYSSWSRHSPQSTPQTVFYKTTPRISARIVSTHSYSGS